MHCTCTVLHAPLSVDIFLILALLFSSHMVYWLLCLIPQRLPWSFLAEVLLIDARSKHDSNRHLHFLLVAINFSLNFLSFELQNTGRTNSPPNCFCIQSGTQTIMQYFVPLFSISSLLQLCNYPLCIVFYAYWLHVALFNSILSHATVLALISNPSSLLAWGSSWWHAGIYSTWFYYCFTQIQINQSVGFHTDLIIYEFFILSKSANEKFNSMWFSVRLHRERGVQE